MMTKKKLTNAQQEVIAQIKRLYRRGEPLNITAVKRRHLELILKTYKTSRFWGWKRALEDAGIDYSMINVELADHVVCNICGFKGRRLEGHIRAAHGMLPRKYRKMFPHADLVCDEIKAKQFCGSSKMPEQGIPHWEPLWTQEYILDRFAELHRMGEPLNPDSLIKKEPRLYSRAQEYFKTLDTVLEIIGLDPKKVRLFARKKKWTREMVIKALCQRVLMGQPVNSTALRESVRSLLGAAEKLFGSYDAALKAAGLDPKKFRKYPVWEKKYKTREDVIYAIQYRTKDGLPINDRGVAKGKHKNVALYSKGRRLFGSWKAAVKAAGFNYDEISLAKV